PSPAQEHPMIRVEIIREISPGKWEWAATCCGRAAGGRSRQPLLDACRTLKRMGADPGQQIGLFWPGRSDWALRTTVGQGADLTVADPASGKGYGFRKYVPLEGVA